MKLSTVYLDQRGTAAVEFGLTAPVFFLTIFAILEFSLIVWTQLGLQHGVEMAARCASINTTLCGSTTSAQSFAAQEAFGLNPPPETFDITTQGCGTMVTANFTYYFLTSYVGGPTLALNAQSCFPK